mgnify:CR=1 FL=1|jgi:hypothetical protein
MANLSYNEITRENREYRSEVLVQKVFQMDGKSNNFVTDDGILVAEYVVINNTKYSSGEPVDIAGKILALKLLPTNQRKVIVGGKMQGQSSRVELSLGKLEKTEEFGGQPAGGTRVNKGIKFEKDFVEVLNEQLSGLKSNKTYSKEVEKVLVRCAEEMRSPVTEVIAEGGMNQSRPIKMQGNQLIIAPYNHAEHGKKLTDITLKHANGKFSYLSLKFSSTLTFMNAGVVQIFTPSDIKSGSIQTTMGKAILDTFGIEDDIFCDVFNNYGRKKFPNVKAKLDKQKLKKFLQTCIGSNYWMVHGMEGGKVYFWEMSDSKNPQYATITGDVEIQYGGKQGNGKRIDIVFSNRYFDFKVNIRNKQGGIYPSHIMCDYKSKPATGKKLL